MTPATSNTFTVRYMDLYELEELVTTHLNPENIPFSWRCDEPKGVYYCDGTERQDDPHRLRLFHADSRFYRTTPAFDAFVFLNYLIAKNVLPAGYYTMEEPTDYATSGAEYD